MLAMPARNNSVHTVQARRPHTQMGTFLT